MSSPTEKGEAKSWFAPLTQRCSKLLLQIKVHLLCISDMVRSSWTISVDLSLIIHNGPTSSSHCFIIWSSLAKFPPVLGTLAVLSMLVILPCSHCCVYFPCTFTNVVLHLFFHPHLSLFWSQCQFFPLLSIWLQENSNMAATNNPFAFIQWRNLCFLLLLQWLPVTF